MVRFALVMLISNLLAVAETTSRVLRANPVFDDVACKPTDPNDQRVHFMRVPKTGSTSALEILENDSCFKRRVHIHDHKNGCLDLQSCNGSCLSPLPSASFAVIRDPCARFLSVTAHMQLVQSPVLDLGQPSFSQSVEKLLDFYRGSGCRGNTDPVCLTKYINRFTTANFTSPKNTIPMWMHRVILYPQSFYVGRDTEIVCFKNDDILPDLFERLSGPARCNLPKAVVEEIEGRSISKMNNPHPTKVDPLVCKEVRDLLACDTSMWDRSCGASGSPSVSADSTRGPGPRGALPTSSEICLGENAALRLRIRELEAALDVQVAS